jgi:predicted ArsR family transcriptional regulator
MTETKNDSRTTILAELRRRGDLSIDEVVESTGLSKTAVRAHLVRMERDKVIERLEPEIAGPGRPPATFRLTEYGASMFPTSDSALLSRLLNYLNEHDAEGLVTDFFNELWTDKMDALRESLGGTRLDDATLEERIAAIEACLEDQHFMPVIEHVKLDDGSDVVTVCECNCPFRTAADVSRAPCQLEVDFLSKALGATPRKVTIAVDRRNTCTFEFVVQK